MSHQPKRNLLDTFLAGNYVFNVNNENTRARCKICSKLKIRRCSGVFIVNLEHVSHIVLAFLLLIMSRQMPTGFNIHRLSSV